MRMSPEELEPTEEITLAIKDSFAEKNTDEEKRTRLVALFTKYGHAFSCTAELGGKLQTTRIVDTTTDVSVGGRIHCITEAITC